MSVPELVESMHILGIAWQKYYLDNKCTGNCWWKGWRI